MEIMNRVAVVTGASSGIGSAAARLLSKRGATVILAARSDDKLEGLAKTLPGSYAVHADMTKPDQIRNLFKQAKRRYGRIDIMVNNAGRGYDAPVEKIKEDIYRDIIDLDLIGPLTAMKEAIPIMKAQGGGSIVNISSGAALMYLPGMGAYSSIKRALAHLSLTAREELGNSNIIVSVVYPYITLTDFEKNTIKEGPREWSGRPVHPPDTAEQAAELIVSAIQNGTAEVYAHGWMRQSVHK